MSLAASLKAKREESGKLAAKMRDLAVAMQGEKNATRKAEMDVEFDKVRVDWAEAKKGLQQLESAVEAEREMNTVVNGVPLNRHDANRQPGEPLSHENLMERLEKASAHQVARDNVAKAVREHHNRYFNAYLRRGDKDEQFSEAGSELSEVLTAAGTAARETHALLGVQQALGGFLVPEDFRAEIVKNLAGFAVIRAAGARVIPTSLSTLVFPAIAPGQDPYPTGVSGAWRQEGSQGVDGSVPARQTQPTFQQERIPIHVWQPGAIVVTRELLEDSAIPIDSLIAQLIAETKGLDEDAAFIKGTGVGQPRGLQDYVTGAAPNITTVASGASGAQTYNGLIDLMMNLHAQYRQKACFFMRSTVFGEILKLKDSSQMPIMYANALPDTLFGKKVWISEQFPVSAAGNVPVYFGDVRFYCIGERVDLRMQRLEERFAPNVGFLATARLGGGLLRTDAFVASQE